MMDAVKILLDRMDTNPEEFTKHGPWAAIIFEYKDLIPPDEVELLDRKLDEVRVKQFTAAVIEQLMQDKVPKGGYSGAMATTMGGDAFVYKTKNRYAIEELK